MAEAKTWACDGPMKKASAACALALAPPEGLGLLLLGLLICKVVSGLFLVFHCSFGMCSLGPETFPVRSLQRQGIWDVTQMYSANAVN